MLKENELAERTIHADIIEANITSLDGQDDVLHIKVRVTLGDMQVSQHLHFALEDGFTADRIMAGCNILVEDLR